MEKIKRKHSMVDLGGIPKLKARGNNAWEHTAVKIEEKPSNHDGMET